MVLITGAANGIGWATQGIRVSALRGSRMPADDRALAERS
jgi:NAD(P)-dependent dehydrogenase (short-subunit alcohol dehydrogenase family)